MLIGFRQFLESIIDDAPSVPADRRWLDSSHYEPYTDNPDEVSIKSLGLKMFDSDHMGTSSGARKHGFSAAGYQEHDYGKTALQHIDLSKVHYTQPSVNREKIKHLMDHYHPEHTDFHQTDGTLSKWEAPHVTKYPDGSYVTGDHHRLIACHLRGDTHAIARVTEMGPGTRRGSKVLIQKKAKSHF
jgi:hypothetical protein